MRDPIHAEMMRYVGFTTADAENLRSLALQAETVIPTVVERFYEEIMRSPSARTVLADPAQVARLRRSLASWLNDLFEGDYGDAYWRKRTEIGHAHVRVRLPQQYMFAAMEIIWQELRDGLRREFVGNADASLASLHKLLTVETAVMLQSYRESSNEHIRKLERRAVHEQLFRAEKLAEVGQLAASLAHEIKNPLAGISGAIQVLRGTMALDNPHRPILDEILRQVTRLDGTVKDLLIYARPRPPRLESCRLDRVIERVMTVLHQEPALQRIRLEFAADASIPPIRADETQIEQVVINLLQNAADASRANGLVRLKTSIAEGIVRISVEDHGVGMDVATCERAFEPFFTRKAKGTGLGLPICKKIIESHGGTISIHSREGEGTTVTVELPETGAAQESQGRTHADSRSAG